MQVSNKINYYVSVSSAKLSLDISNEMRKIHGNSHNFTKYNRFILCFNIYPVCELMNVQHEVSKTNKQLGIFCQFHTYNYIPYHVRIYSRMKNVSAPLMLLLLHIYNLPSLIPDNNTLALEDVFFRSFLILYLDIIFKDDFKMSSTQYGKTSLRTFYNLS